MAHQVLIVGRSRRADIRLRDLSVSRQHAELVVGSDGTLHIADRSSANGTWIEAEGRWQRLRQRTVAADDRLRLGNLEITDCEEAGGGRGVPGAGGG